MPSMMQVWQPVMPHLAWIRGIMAGEPGKSPVVDLWKADSGAVCKAEAKEVEAESKETKKEETHEEVKEPRRKIFGKWGPSDKVEKHAKTRQQKQHIKAPSSGQ